MEDSMSNDALFSSMLRAGRTTYFLDVKQAKNGKKYLAITETRIDASDKKSRSVIRIFSESVASFQQAVNEAAAAVQS
jgi:hypothetical protein